MKAMGGKDITELSDRMQLLIHWILGLLLMVPSLWHLMERGWPLIASIVLALAILQLIVPGLQMLFHLVQLHCYIFHVMAPALITDTEFVWHGTIVSWLLLTSKMQMKAT